METRHVVFSNTTFKTAVIYEMCYCTLSQAQYLILLKIISGCVERPIDLM